MILLCGVGNETPLAMVHEALVAGGADVVVFDQREWSTTELELELTAGAVGGTLRTNGGAYDLADVTAIYPRMMDDQCLPDVADTDPASPVRWRCRVLHQLLHQFIELSDARVLNRSAAMASNASKPLQAQLVQRHGFLTPPTLITNEPASARRFLERHGQVIFKSISGQRSIVTRLDGDALARLDVIRACPVQFQALVPGTDVRVHVVGETVHATAIATGAVDYRYARQQGSPPPVLQPATLDEGLARRCISLSVELGLELAGIDLRLMGDRQACCFEVNPSPAFSYYEQHTGQPIAAAIAARLRGGCLVPNGRV